MVVACHSRRNKKAASLPLSDVHKQNLSGTTASQTAVCCQSYLTVPIIRISWLLVRRLLVLVLVLVRQLLVLVRQLLELERQLLELPGPLELVHQLAALVRLQLLVVQQELLQRQHR